MNNPASLRLSALPRSVVRAQIVALRRWAQETTAIRGLKVEAIDDPEDPDWQEVVFTFRLEIESEELIELWDQADELIFEERGRLNLNSEDRELAAKTLALHLVSISEENQ